MSDEAAPDFIFPQDLPSTLIPGTYERKGGLELRDYFAAQALPGIEAVGPTLTGAAMNAAICAYAIADACLIVRKNPMTLEQPKGDS